jgi:hypothetical protein
MPDVRRVFNGGKSFPDIQSTRFSEYSRRTRAQLRDLQVHAQLGSQQR